jgi:hypothetical protein
MEMPQLIVMQQALLRYHGNAIWCIGHVTKENLICRNSNKLKLIQCIHKASETKVLQIHIRNLNSPPYQERVLNGDITFTENIKKSTYVICSNGAPGRRSMS